MDGYILRNRTVYWICAAFICLQGLLCVNQIGDGFSIIRSAYEMMYYDQAGLMTIWGVMTLLTGLVALAGYIVTAVGAFLRKIMVVGAGCMVIAASYILAMIRELLGHFVIGGIAFFFLNFLGLALFILLLLTALIETASLRDLILKHTIPAMMVPMGLFILTVIAAAAGYGLGAATFFYNLAEDLAASAIIAVIGSLLLDQDPAVTRGNISFSTEGSDNMGNRDDSPFTSANSVQAPEGYRNVALVIIFGVITFGIYLFYWVYKVSEQINRELMTGKSPAAQMLLFMFVPFYSWYWIYTMSQNIREFSYRKGYDQDSVLPAINLVISIIGFSIVSIAVMQDMLNKAVGENAGSAYRYSQMHQGYQGYDQGQYQGAQQQAQQEQAAQNTQSAQSAQNAQSAQSGQSAQSAQQQTYSQARQATDVGAGYFYAGAQSEVHDAYEEEAPAADYEDMAEYEMVEKPSDEAEEAGYHEHQSEEEGEYQVMDEQESGRLDQSIYDLVNEIEREQSPFEKQEEPQTEEKTEETKVPYDELRKLKDLLDEGIITQEEFDQLKQKFIK